MRTERRPFTVLEKEIKEKLIVDQDNRGTIKGAFITSEENFQLYRAYIIAAKSDPYHDIEITNGDFYRGYPDWYFFDGEPGDEYGPGTYRFETLSEQSQRFQEHYNKLMDLVISTEFSAMMAKMVRYNEKVVTKMVTQNERCP